MGITGSVFTEHDDALGSLEGCGPGQCQLGTDDRFDSGSHSLLKKLDCTKEIVMIGQPDGIHAQGLDTRNQIGDLNDTILKRVFRVHAKVNERPHHEPLACLLSSIRAATGAKLLR